MHSPLLMRTLESQTAAEQSWTKKHWNLPKKYPTSKDRGEAMVRWWEGHDHDSINFQSRMKLIKMNTIRSKEFKEKDIKSRNYEKD